MNVALFYPMSISIFNKFLVKIQSTYLYLKKSAKDNGPKLFRYKCNSRKCKCIRKMENRVWFTHNFCHEKL